MALVVEDGSGKTDAESYTSEAVATAYHLVHSISTTWAAASTPVREAALRQATQYLDTAYKDQWAAARYSDDQLLDWPRIGLIIDDVAYDASDLPSQLTEACAELALKVVDGDTIFADMADEGTLSSQTVRVGPITESKTYVGGSEGIKRYRLVEAMIRPLLDISTAVERA